MKANLEVDIDLSDIAECIDLEELTRKVSDDVAENLDLDSIAEKVADSIDTDSLAEQIGENISVADVAEHISGDLDYEEFAKAVSVDEVANALGEDSEFVTAVAKKVATLMGTVASPVTPPAEVLPPSPPPPPPAPSLTEDDVRRIMREEFAAMISRLFLK